MILEEQTMRITGLCAHACCLGRIKPLVHIVEIQGSNSSMLRISFMDGIYERI